MEEICAQPLEQFFCHVVTPDVSGRENEIVRHWIGDHAPKMSMIWLTLAKIDYKSRVSWLVSLKRFLEF